MNRQPIAHTRRTDPDVHSVAVAGIVLDDQGRVLLMHRRDYDNWEPPGGVLHPQEAMHQGLAREVFEETRVSVEPLWLSGVYKNTETAVITLVFRCSAPHAEPQTTEEASESAWVTLEEVEALVDDGYRRWIADAASQTGSPTVVVHQSDTVKGASASPIQAQSSRSRER